MKPHTHTPLPWRAQQPAHDPQAWDIATESGGAFAKLTWFASRENSAYIVHAANAYPKLVAALQKFIGAEAEFMRDTGLALDDAVWEADRDAQKLLKELGEHHLEQSAA